MTLKYNYKTKRCCNKFRQHKMATTTFTIQILPHAFILLSLSLCYSPCSVSVSVRPEVDAFRVKFTRMQATENDDLLFAGLDEEE